MARDPLRRHDDGLRELIDQKEDGWLRLAAIKEMMDRLWGKAQQHVTLDTDATIASVYESIDDIRRDLIESALPPITWKRHAC